MRYRFLKPILIFSLLIAANNVNAQRVHPFAGNWILDVPASTFTSTPAPQSQTRAYQVRPGEVFVFILDGVEADGTRVHSSATYKYDSQEYPLAVSNQQQAMTIAYTQINPRTVEYVIRAGGEVIQSGTKDASVDSRTMTITAKTTSAEGQHFTDRLVFRKQ